MTPRLFDEEKLYGLLSAHFLMKMEDAEMEDKLSDFIESEIKRNIKSAAKPLIARIEESIDWLRDLSDRDSKQTLLDHIIATDGVLKEALSAWNGREGK